MESKKRSRSRRQAGMRFLLASAGFKFVLLFNPEDGGDDPLKHEAASKLHNTLYSHHCKSLKSNMATTVPAS
jgi:hypothetical protein